MAVVGSGPAGFYTAYRVMSKIEGAKVDMYEALPVPFGLARFGVAPDHPEVKNCQDKFEEVAASPDFTFIGNARVGGVGGELDSPYVSSSSRYYAPLFGRYVERFKTACNIPLNRLMRHYDAVLFAYGASKDKKLRIPGEDEIGHIYSAREFVGWYNGLPGYAELDPDLTSLERGDTAVIIGQGNVALDVARMLLEDIDVLRKTDIAEAALEVLSKSRIKRVHVVGRRGPMQAAFTTKELRELMKLKDVGFQHVDPSLIPEDIKTLPRPRKRLAEVILKGTSLPFEEAPKRFSLDFCLSPTSFRADNDGYVRATAFERTVLDAPFDSKSRVARTGEVAVLDSSVVISSIGYQSVALPGFAEAGISFDDKRGVMRNDGLGRVYSTTGGDDEIPLPLPGAYCAGWVKLGPTGVIASTMNDSFITGDAIAEDWASGAAFLGNGAGSSADGWEGVRRDVDCSACRVVTWDDWHVIDAAEKARGKLVGKEREKLTSSLELLSVLK